MHSKAILLASLINENLIDVDSNQFCFPKKDNMGHCVICTFFNEPKKKIICECAVKFDKS
jgi:hypothetical protein